MEKQVKFYPAQEVPSSELNALQDFAQGAIDHVVNDLLVRDSYYHGMGVSQPGPTDVQVAPGRIFVGGKVYSLDASVTISLTPYLPAGLNKKRISIVASGIIADTEAAPRKFLVDPTTRTSRPRTVNTRSERQVVLSVIEGPEGTAPVDATVASGYIEIATVDLSSTGIIDGPNRSFDAVAPSLEDAVTAITILQGEWSAQKAQINTLRTDVAAIAKKLAGAATSRDLNIAFNELARVREAMNIPDMWARVGIDAFYDDEECDTANGSFNGEVWAGAFHFGHTKVSLTPSLLNPIASNVTVHPTGLMLPAYSEVARTAVVKKSGEVLLNSYAVVSQNLASLQEGVLFRWDPIHHLALVSNALRSGASTMKVYVPAVDDFRDLDLTKYVFETIGNNAVDPASQWGSSVALLEHIAYWGEPSVTETLAGSTIAQTVLNAQGGWLTRIDIPFTQLGSAGGVNLRVCHVTKEGEPDLNRVIASANVAFSGLKSWPNWTSFPLKPAHLAKGERYAIVLKSTGAHRVATSNTDELTSGTLLYATDATTWDSRLGVDMLFQTYFASFKSARTIIELNSVSLVGGIDTINGHWTGIHPYATDFVLQAQIAGVWRTYDYRDPGVFASRPDLVPLRLVIDGTKDDAPGLYLNKSKLVVGRRNTAAVYISTVRTIDPALNLATEVAVDCAMLDYDPAYHTFTPKLMVGGSYGTTVNADSIVQHDPASDNPRITAWRAHFTLSPGRSAYKVRVDMATTDATVPFAIRGRSDWVVAHT